MSKNNYLGSYRKKRSKRPLVLFLFFFIASLLFFRNTIACHLIDVYVGAILRDHPQMQLVIDKREKVHGRLDLKKVHFTSDTVEIETDQISFYTSVNLFPFSITTYVDIETPKIRVLDKKTGPADSSFLSWFFPHPYFHLKINIQDGVIDLSDSLAQPLFFSYLSKNTPGHLGTFLLHQDKSSQQAPLCMIQMSSVDGLLALHADIIATDLSILEPLLPLFSLDHDLVIDHVEGSLCIHADAVFNEQTHIAKLVADVDIANLILSTSNSLYCLQIPSSKGQLCYPPADCLDQGDIDDPQIPFWKKAQGRLVLSQVECVLDYGQIVTVKNIDAEVLLSPNQDPSIALDALILSGKQQIPISMRSSGCIYSDSNFWLQGDLIFGGQKLHDPLLSLSICKVDRDSYVVQTNFRNLNHEVLSLCGGIAALPSGYSVQADFFEGAITTWFHHGRISRVQWDDVSATNISWKVEHQKLLAGTGSCTSRGDMIKEKDVWQIQSCEYQITKGFIHQEALQVRDITLGLHFGDGVFQPSQCIGHWDQGMITLDVYGPIGHVESHIAITSSWNHFLHLLGVDAAGMPDVDMQARCTASLGSNVLSIQAESSFATLTEAHGTLSSSMTIPLEGIGSFWNKKIEKLSITGNVAIQELSHIVYLPLLRSFQPDLDVSGCFSLDGTIEEGCFVGTGVSEGLFINNGPIGLSTGFLEKERTRFSYDFIQGDFSAEVGIADGYFADQPSQFYLSHIKGYFQWKDHILNAPEITALCETVEVPLALYYDHQGWSIETDPIQARIEELYKIEPFRCWVGALGKNMQGSIRMPKGGCNILLQKSATGWIWHYKITARIEELACPISSYMEIEHAGCDFFLDSSTGLSSINNTQGIVKLWGDDHHFALADFVYDPRKESAFLFTVSDASVTVLSLSGSIKIAKDVQIIFDKEQTHLFSIPLSIGVCQLNRDLDLQKVDIGWDLSTKDRQRCFSHLQGFSAFPQHVQSWSRKAIEALEGSLHLESSFTADQGWKMHLYSADLLWNTQPLHDFKVLASYHNHRFVLQNLAWNTCSMQMALHWKKDLVSLTSFQLSMPDVRMDVVAQYLAPSQTLTVESLKYSLVSSALPPSFNSLLKGSVKGQLRGSCIFDNAYTVEQAEIGGSIQGRLSYPVPCDINSAQDFSARYTKTEGYRLGGLDLRAFVKNTSEFIAKFTCNALSCVSFHDPILIKQCAIELAPNGTQALVSSGVLSKEILYLKKDLDWHVSGDLSWGAAGIQALLCLPSGMYAVSGSDYDLITPQLELQPASMHVRSKAKIASHVLFCDLQKDFNQEAPLFILLRSPQDVDGMKIVCKETNGIFTPVRLEGKLLGLDMNIQKSTHIHDGSFFGEIRIDCLKAKQLLPKAIQCIIDSLQLGSGYTLKGHFFVPESDDQEFSFQGDIQGNKCLFLGYTIDAIIVKASITPTKCLLEDIKLEDQAGHLSVKYLRIDKDPFSNQWQLEMPLGHLRECKPSLLLSSGKRGTEKAFVLKNLSVYELRGTLGDMKSFVGKGALHFYNANKKEFSLLDIPIEMFKDLGLDTGILTPISGEVDFTIKKGRCMFIDLKNSYSEGRRSEFYLSGDTLAYVDFEGNWHVDLKMKQHVLLKWSESLIVSIRGTLNKPKYSLKNINDSL